jgi:hypothetical protein
MARCQYALKKYLSKSCTKRSYAPKELLYPFPEDQNEEIDKA